MGDPPPIPAPAAPLRARALARLAALWATLAPGPRVWSGAAWGLIAATVGILVARLLNMVNGWGTSPVVVLGLPIALGLALAGGVAVVALVRVLAALPGRFRLVLASSSCVLLYFVFPGSVAERLPPALYLVVAATVAGAAAGDILRWRKARPSRGRALLALTGLAIGGGALAAGVLGLVGEGNDDPAIVDASARGPGPAALDLPDPAGAGTYHVKKITYGSGNDRHRNEYGAAVNLRTRSVDGTRFIGGWSGFDGWARTRYWGFGPHALPINGRMFVPEGDGPFPVVVIVHGGHPMDDPSEPGYDYLGEHLAAHGYVVASVDENFLNGTPWSDVAAGLTNDNLVRGWLLLEHLRAFRGWNGAAAGPLRGKLDMDRVALVGHSKGGEAIGVAAAFNRLTHDPDDATIRFDYGFGIRALVALSTTDRQYLPGGVPTRLDDVDFLALQGSNDGDVDWFMGAQQYDRVRLDPAGHHFKAAVFVHRANHGQWNRRWGRRDKSRFPKQLYFNRKPLLPPEVQEHVARAYLTAFFDASLRGDRRYLPFLQDHRAGKAWLPDTVVLSRFEEASRTYVAHFDEDIDVTTTTVPGGHISGEGLTLWREQMAGMAGTAEGRGAYVGWDAATGEEARYTVALPGGFPVDPQGAFVLALGDAKEAPNPRGLHAAGRTPARAAPGGSREPIDLSVELVDREGHTARLPLSSVGLVQPEIEAGVWKRWLGTRPRREVAFQTFALPIARFVAESPGLDPAQLAAVRLVFDRTPSGVLVVRDVGFAPR